MPIFLFPLVSSVCLALGWEAIAEGFEPKKDGYGGLHERTHCFPTRRHSEAYGVDSASGGQRGVTFRPFTADEITAHNEDEAEQGHVFLSAGPP